MLQLLFQIITLNVNSLPNLGTQIYYYIYFIQCGTLTNHLANHSLEIENTVPHKIYWFR